MIVMVDSLGPVKAVLINIHTTYISDALCNHNINSILYMHKIYIVFKA